MKNRMLKILSFAIIFSGEILGLYFYKSVIILIGPLYRRLNPDFLVQGIIFILSGLLLWYTLYFLRQMTDTPGFISHWILRLPVLLFLGCISVYLLFAVVGLFLNGVFDGVYYIYTLLYRK